MRGSFVVILVVLFAVGIGAGVASNRGFFGNVLLQRHSVPSPLGACTQASGQQAVTLAETLVGALNRLDPAPIGELIDIETPFGLSIHELQLSTRERRDFLRGAADAAKQKNPLAERWMDDLAENDRARLLRIAVVDGHQHAMVRLLLGDTITYIDLVIARTPSGQVRVVDFFDIATGELFSRTLTTILLPTLANMTKTPLERLIEGSRNEALLEPKKL